MTKRIRTRRQIFRIPLALATITLAALVAGLLGGEGGWPLVWGGMAMPLITAVWCVRHRG